MLRDLIPIPTWIEHPSFTIDLLLPVL